jgi:hypothetical protein
VASGRPKRVDKSYRPAKDIRSTSSHFPAGGGHKSTSHILNFPLHGVIRIAVYCYQCFEWLYLVLWLLFTARSTLWVNQWSGEVEFASLISWLYKLWLGKNYIFNKNILIVWTNSTIPWPWLSGSVGFPFFNGRRVLCLATRGPKPKTQKVLYLLN